MRKYIFISRTTARLECAWRLLTNPLHPTYSVYSRTNIICIANDNMATLGDKEQTRITHTIYGDTILCPDL